MCIEINVNIPHASSHNVCTDSLHKRAADENIVENSQKYQDFVEYGVEFAWQEDRYG